MLSWTIWSVGILLEALILFRGFQGKFVSRYPFFYAYSGCVLFVSVLTYFVYAQDSTSSGMWYWGAQLVSLISGYGILLEIFNHVLSPYPGAEKFARVTGFIVFGVIFCFALAYPLMRSQWSPAGTMVELERNLRTVQAIFICAVSCVISYYGIAIGKNMKGMIAGYGLYVATSLVILAVRSYAGVRFDEVWKVVQPLSYDISLIVWSVTLWSYQPNPVAERSIQLEADYETCVARTRSLMGGMRSSLGKVARP
jgi:hypothetical protein